MLVAAGTKPSVAALRQVAAAGGLVLATSGRSAVPVSHLASLLRIGTTVNHPTAATMPPSARPGEYIARVMRADIDPGEGHQQGQYGGDDAPSPVGEQEPDRDCAGDGGVVAREREVCGLVHEEMYVRHRLVGAGAVDRTTDELAGTERERPRRQRPTRWRRRR